MNLPVLLSSLPVSARLSAVIRALAVAVGGWQAQGRISAALTMLMVDRFRAACLRMEDLAARFAAGTLVVRAARVRVAAEVVPEPRAAVERVRVWPRRFGWLVQHMTYHAAVFGSQLRDVLVEPEMVALLKACPQAVRIMRPMCRALGVETALLRPGVPPVVRKVRPRAPRKKRPSEIIVYRPRGPGPGLGNPSTMIFNKRTGGLRFVPTKW